MKECSRSIVLAGLVAFAAGCSQSYDSPLAPTAVGSTEARQTPTVTTTMTVNGCDFTVTYTWSGLKGRNLIASFGLYQRAGGLDASFNLQNVEGQSGSGGSVSHTFQLTPNAHAGRLVVARGSLIETRKFKQIAGSSAASSNTVFSTCG
jgi:hypothetical protein